MIYHLHDWPWIHLMLDCILIWLVFVNWSLICFQQYSSPKHKQIMVGFWFFLTQKTHGFEYIFHWWATHDLFALQKQSCSMVNVTWCVFWSVLSSSFGWLRVIFVICLRIKLRSDFPLSRPRACKIWFSPRPGKYWNISERKQLGDISQEWNLIIQYTSFFDLYMALDFKWFHGLLAFFSCMNINCWVRRLERFTLGPEANNIPLSIRKRQRL